MMQGRSILTGSALSSRVGQRTLPGIVKQIQRGVISITGATSNTATITSVDVSNSVIAFLGQAYSNVSTDPSIGQARVALTNATTVTATIVTTPGAQIVTVSYEVIEYWPGVIKSVQRGTIAGAATATITTVNTLKSCLTQLGWTTTDVTQDLKINPKLVLTNATTVTQSGGVITNVTGGFQVVELF